MIAMVIAPRFTAGVENHAFYDARYLVMFSPLGLLMTSARIATPDDATEVAVPYFIGSSAGLL